MVSLAIEPKTDSKCPLCDRKFAAISVLKIVSDDAGRQVRNFLSWCDNCSLGFEVIDFRRNLDAAWRIHKYRWYSQNGEVSKSTPGDWITVNPLDEPPAVLTGPGGDFVSGLDVPTSEAVKVLLINLKVIAARLRKLIGIAS